MTLRDQIKTSPRWGDDSGMEAVASHIKPTSGINFIRAGDRPEKTKSRLAVLGLFGAAWPDDLSILVLPGLRWQFEKALLAQRAGVKGDYFRMIKSAAARTKIYAVEKDPAIYTASLAYLPGRGKLTIKFSVPSAWAVSEVNTKIVERYTCCDLTAWVANSGVSVDAAWIDLSGPLSVELLGSIAELWHTRSMRQIVVTCMAGRHQPGLTRKLAKYDGHAGLLKEVLDSSEVMSCLEYADGAPMVQVALKRV
jgi:hypothetical protein